MRAVLHLTVAFSALVLAVVIGLATLAHLKFSSFLAASVRERLDVVASTAARDFRGAMDLGLALGQVANGTSILDRARAHDSEIRAILVFDVAGTVLHASGDETGGRIDADVYGAFRRADAAGLGRWGVENEVRIGSGVVLSGSIGQTVGGIVVEYPIEEMQGSTHIMARRVVRAAGWVGAGIVVAMITVLVCFHGPLRRLEDAVGAS